MPTQKEVEGILDIIKRRLDDEAARIGVRLQVSDSSLEDEWLYVVVTPIEAGVRASDHAELMAKIERELRESGAENVLLVPTITE